MSILIGLGVIPLSLLTRFISRQFFGINVPEVRLLLSSAASALCLQLFVPALMWFKSDAHHMCHLGGHMRNTTLPAVLARQTCCC